MSSCRGDHVNHWEELYLFSYFATPYFLKQAKKLEKLDNNIITRIPLFFRILFLVGFFVLFFSISANSRAIVGLIILCVWLMFLNNPGPNLDAAPTERLESVPSKPGIQLPYKSIY
jgi:hypothetical protein